MRPIILALALLASFAQADDLRYLFEPSDEPLTAEQATNQCRGGVQLATAAYFAAVGDAQHPEPTRIAYAVDYFSSMLAYPVDMAAAHAGAQYIAGRMKQTNFRLPPAGPVNEAAREYLVQTCGVE